MLSHQQHCHPRHQRHRARRGFTLIELMVALSAGLIISAAAFMMARSATSFFQHEAGITSAQYSAMVGFTRLQADLKNASFLAPPNVIHQMPLTAVPAGNGEFCILSGESLPAGTHARNPGMEDLSGIVIQSNGSYVEGNATMRGLWDSNGLLKPDSVIVAGSFDTTEEFIAAAVEPSGSSFTVVLNDANDGATIRAANADQRGGASLEQIFKPGRMVRVRDDDGNYSLGVIETFTNLSPVFEIHLADSPLLGKREDTKNCGCAGTCVGAPVSVIARYRYSLADVAAIPDLTAYNNLQLSAEHAGAAYHVGGPPPTVRTELIREELKVDGDPMDDGAAMNPVRDSMQVLAEYAVDLEFGWTVEDVNTIAVPPVNIRIPLLPPVEPAVDRDHPNDYLLIDNTQGAPPGRPDLVRSIQVRLSTRAHRRDRDVGLFQATSTTPVRFFLGANRGYARMRTLIADVQLPNQSKRLRD